MVPNYRRWWVKVSAFSQRFAWSTTMRTDPLTPLYGHKNDAHEYSVIQHVVMTPSMPKDYRTLWLSELKDVFQPHSPVRHPQVPAAPAAPLSPEEEKERKRAEILCFAERGLLFSMRFFCFLWVVGRSGWKGAFFILIGFLWFSFPRLWHEIHTFLRGLVFFLLGFWRENPSLCLAFLKQGLLGIRLLIVELQSEGLLWSD